MLNINDIDYDIRCVSRTMSICFLEAGHLCDFKPGSENLRLAAVANDQQGYQPGDSLRLQCNSASWRYLMGEEDVTVDCEWVYSPIDIHKQAYWKTTNLQRDLCLGKY